MSKKIYIISDLHLSEKNPKIITLFKKFISDISSNENILYILGDFFDYWIGDDDLNDFHLDIIQTLKQASNNGLNIFFMCGNRDFLIGQKFAKMTNIKLLKDPFYTQINNNKYLIMHGDLLCTADKQYLLFRKIVQSNIFKFLFTKLPLTIRIKMALKTRKHSYKKNMKNKITDVTSEGINKYIKNSNILIHGHTHQMNIHNKDKYIRYVLGDWYNDGNYLLIKNNKIYLHKYPN